MAIVLNIFAFLRAIIIFGTMSKFMLAYSIKSVFVPHSRERAFILRRSWLSWIALPVLNINVILEGKVSQQKAIYVCNHRSFSDPIVICKYLDAMVIAKAEVANYPIINKGAEMTGVIWVNRADKDSRKNTRSKLMETLMEGYNVMVFPEGTVGKDKNTLPFRIGTFIEAAQNNIPIVPVALEYRSKKDLWVLQKFIPQYFYQFSKWKTEVKLAFGEPIMNSDGQILHDLAYTWINDKLEEMQKGWSKAFN